MKTVVLIINWFKECQWESLTGLSKIPIDTLEIIMIRYGFQKGFGTLEILIAFTVGILCLCSVVLVSFGSQSVLSDSQSLNEAQNKARELLEQADANSKVDFDLVNILPVPPFQFVSDGIFRKTLAVNMLDAYTKKVSAKVAWTADKNRELFSEMTALITNPEGLENNNQCYSVLSNSSAWKTPRHFDFPTQNLTPGNVGLGVSDIKVINQKLFLTANTTANSGDTFYIFDLPNNPSQVPIYKSSLDNSTVSAGLNALVVAGNYAYVANAYGANFSTCVQGNRCAQLQIIDITDLAHPVVVKNFKIPGVTGTSGQGIGTSIFYKNGFVYVGLAKTLSGPEFNIIDVGGGGTSASPLNPIWKGGYSVGNGINSIYVKNNLAYLATPNSENLTIIDVGLESSTFSQKIGGFAPSVGSNNGTNISVIGNTAYLGRTFGNTEFYILDIYNPLSISAKASRDIGVGSQTSIHGLVVRDFLVFFVTNSQFQIWDISNLSNVTPWTTDGSTNSFLSFSNFTNGNGLGNGVALNCSNDYFYVSLTSPLGSNKDIVSVITPGS